MNEQLENRLHEIADELYAIVKRPDIYAFIVVNADQTGDNTRVMSNLSDNDLERFLADVGMRMYQKIGKEPQ